MGYSSRDYANILHQRPFEVTRSGNLSQELTTTYFVTGTGAHPADGADFEGGTLPTGTVHFAAHDSTPQVITLHVVADQDAEKDEGFDVILGPTTGSVNPGRASGTIVDDDTARFSIVPSLPRAEGTSVATPFIFAVTRSGDTDGTQTISYSVAADPTDVSGPFSGSITFAPSETTKTINIGVIADTVVEPNDTFTVTLTDPHVAGIEFNNKQSIGTIVNDDPDLPPWPRPVMRGDPHLVSFDGLAYDFQAAGEFVLAQGEEGARVEVQARTAPIGDLASNITAIATLIDGHRVTIDTLAAEPMRIDGVVTEVPADTGFVNVGKATIAFDGSTYTLIDPGRVSLIVQDFGDRLDMVMSADQSLAGTLTGLLGNFNGDTADDLMLVDGTVLSQPIRFADLYGSFANAWRVTQENSLFDYGSGATTDTYTDRDFPRMALTLDMLPAELVSRATQLVDQAGITDPTVRAATILDLAVTGDLSFLASAAIPVEPRATVEVVDAPPPLAVLSVASVATTQAEGDDGTTAFDFDLFRSGNTAGSLEVFYEVVPIGDHPASAADFSGSTFPKGSLTIFDGQERAKIAVAVAGDSAAEHSETFALKITVSDADKSSVLIAVPAAPATVENDDGDLPARLDIEPATASAAEGDSGLTTLTFEVLRSENLTTETTVDYSVQGTGNHPAQGDDFDSGTYPTGTLNFLADETRKVITISVASDTTVESDEGFVVTLTNAGNAVLGVATATGSILNDDTLPAPTLAISAADADKEEGNSGTTAFTFVVRRTGDTSAETSVDYAVTSLGIEPASAADFGGVFPTGRVNFSANETEKLITIAVSGDVAVEFDEGFTVTLGSATNGTITTSSADGIIQNDDLPPPPELVIAARDAARAEGDSGLTAYTFVVTRTGDLSQTTTVSYAVAGASPNPTDPADFGGTLPIGTVSFAAGEHEKLLSIAVSGDTTVEHDEGFVVMLADVSNGTLTTASAAGTIQNDDRLPPPELAIAARDAVKAEGDSGSTVLTFAVTRSGDTSAETSVDYLVAGSGTDPANATDFGGAYPAGSVLFAAGQHEKLITIEVSGDTTVEPHEGFSVTLANPGNGTLAVASAVGTIQNDDVLPPPTLRIAPVHAQQAEGDAGSTAFTFAISRSGDLSTETTVQYGVNGVATADDFAGAILPGGTVVFAPGNAEQLITIAVAGDRKIEHDEAFAVSLYDPLNATLAIGNADGVILNDDTSSFKIGDAPARPPRSDAGAWERSWTHDGIRISHKADLNDASEPYTDVLLGSSGSGVLAGGDISAGDLGVSGQTKATSSVLQEIDGTEGLRFLLDEEANQITLQLSRFLRNDDGTGLNEAGRLQLLDADGSLVDELFFYADQTDGTKQVTLSVAEGFTQAILSAGAQNGEDFVYGGYGNVDGSGFGASPFAANGGLHGSDYLVDSVGFVSGYVDLLWL